MARSAKRDSASDAHPDRLKASAEGRNPAAVALGRLGGIKGGRARAAKLTPDERSQIARRAAEARWRDRSGGSR